MGWPGYVEDPEIRLAFEWLLSFVSPEDWLARKSIIDSYLEAQTNPRTNPVSITSEDSRVSFEEDQIAWYLYLAEAYLTHPQDYDFAQGARVIPILKTFGRYFDLLKRIGGLEDRVSRIINKEKNQADAGLFELMVALTYARNGWPHVEFISVNPDEKTPDIFAANEDFEWHIECKRLAKSSQYSIKERQKWLEMWSLIISRMTRLHNCLLLEITFHIELQCLERDFLENELLPKLSFVATSGIVIDDEIWKVKATILNLDQLNSRLKYQSTKLASSSFVNLISGKYESFKGFSSAVIAKPSSFHPSYIDSIGFVVGVIWSCDAESAIQKKARDITRRLAVATEQLPDNKPGIIHIALEALDGWDVERERYRKIVNTLYRWLAKGKDLHWFFCHIFDPQVPPDENWDFGEMTYYFNKEDAYKTPLENPNTVAIENTTDKKGYYWD